MDSQIPSHRDLHVDLEMIEDWTPYVLSRLRETARFLVNKSEKPAVTEKQYHNFARFLAV